MSLDFPIEWPKQTQSHKMGEKHRDMTSNKMIMIMMAFYYIEAFKGKINLGGALNVSKSFL